MVSRIACLNLPEFPLQLLLKQHPHWREHAVAVVDRDAAQGIVLWANERARACRVLPGLRYAAALSLVPGLRAGEVARAEIDDAVGALTARLRFYTPDVEPSTGEPGVFWLGASGLSLLYPSMQRWAELIRDEVMRAGFAASIVVGFTRFGTHALAMATRGPSGSAGGAEPGPPRRPCAGGGGSATGPAPACTLVPESADEERERARSVPLARLPIDPGARDTLARLGVTTLGGLLELPANGIRTRFGEDAYRFHRAGTGALDTPLQPAPPPEPVLATVHLDAPETSLDRLLTVIERELRALARALDERARVLSAIAVRLEFDDGSATAERLQPASPTLDLARIVELLRLRLAAVMTAHAGARGVTTVRVECEGAMPIHAQAELFAAATARDRAAAARAMARVRAEFGDDAVVRAVLRDAHLPEASYTWERVDAVPEAKPRAVRAPTRVRRIHARAVPFAPGRHRDAQAELIRHIDAGTVRETLGPYIVSGGWWSREVQREYYFVRLADDRVLWMYYDRPRMGWFIQGEVE